jgi:hypothetical protein
MDTLWTDASWEVQKTAREKFLNHVFVKGVVISTGYEVLVYFNNASFPALFIRNGIGK